MKLPTDAEKSIGVAIIQGEMGLSENHFENGWIHQWICWCPILSQTHMGMGIPLLGYGIWDQYAKHTVHINRDICLYKWDVIP